MTFGIYLVVPFSTVPVISLSRFRYQRQIALQGSDYPAIRRDYLVRAMDTKFLVATGKLHAKEVIKHGRSYYRVMP